MFGRKVYIISWTLCRSCHVKSKVSETWNYSTVCTRMRISDGSTFGIRVLLPPSFLTCCSATADCASVSFVDSAFWMLQPVDTGCQCRNSFSHFCAHCRTAPFLRVLLAASSEPRMSRKNVLVRKCSGKNIAGM
jgi:hypothetical protein